MRRKSQGCLSIYCLIVAVLIAALMAVAIISTSKTVSIENTLRTQWVSVSAQSRAHIQDDVWDMVVRSFAHPAFSFTAVALATTQTLAFQARSVIQVSKPILPWSRAVSPWLISTLLNSTFSSLACSSVSSVRISSSPYITSSIALNIILLVSAVGLICANSDDNRIHSYQ